MLSGDETWPVNKMKQQDNMQKSVWRQGRLVLNWRISYLAWNWNNSQQQTIYLV